MQSFRRKNFLILAMMAFLSLVIILPSKTEAKDEIKIGVLQPLTGALAPIGQLGKYARELAVEEINAAGGIKSLGGAKLQLVFADSQGQPQIGVSESERLITKENVVMMTGAYQSSVTLPSSEVAERYKKVWYIPVASEDKITERGFKYLFRSGDTSGLRINSQINFLNDIVEQTGEQVKTVALVYENTAFGQGVNELWKKYLAKTPFKIVLEEPYSASASDLTPVITKVIKAKPEVVFLCSYVSDAALLVKGFSQQKFKPKAFLGTSAGFGDPQFINLAGKEAIGYFDISLWDEDVRRRGTKELAEKFRKKYKMDMNGQAIQCYASMYVIKDVLERAKSTDTEKIREAFAKTNITSGPTEVYAHQIYFDEKGQFPKPPHTIVQFREVNGKIQRVTVWPSKDARGEEWKPVFPAYK
jgi:branched-chain amino acid transport system substrate-binding protein